ncbi:MAG TPA: VWA domain-containing protein [Blastocatellia bacterium]|nr:VWA domain-containing protein [Blastocatellia bacterium]
MSLKTVAVLLLCLAQAAPVLSQQPSTPAPSTPAQDQDTIRLGTSTVQFDVIVTDKNGRRINGLTAADFEIIDEKTPRKIDFFAAFEGSALRPVAQDGKPGAAPDPAKADAASSPLVVPFQGRFIALLFDTYNISTENFNRARKSLTEYINTQVSPNDMVSVTSTGGYHGALQQFTSDKQRLQSALARIAAQTSPERTSHRLNMTPAEAARVDSGDTIMLDIVVNRLAQEGNDFGAMPREQLENQVRVEARAVLSQASQVATATLRTLENLFKGMAELPGRKIAVLMTEQMFVAEGTTGDISKQVDRVIDLARRSGISIYALDAGGLRTNSTTASDRITGAALNARNKEASASFTDFQTLGAARALTLATGGELIANTNSIGQGLQRAVEDSSTYYVLGFTPTEPPDNKFHRVTVTVKGKPDLVVRTRRGYLAYNEETARGTNTEMTAALYSPVQRTDLPLEIVANVVPDRGAQIIQTGLHIGRNYLSLPAADAPEQTAAYEVAMIVFAVNNSQKVGAVETTVAYDFTKTPEARQKLKSDGFILVKEFAELAPGNYQIKAVVREKKTGLIGSGYQFFEVPDVKNRKNTSLSSLVLTTAEQQGFTGHNSFKPNTPIDVRYIIYNLPKDDKTLTQKVRLIDSKGAVLLDSPLAVAPVAAGADETIAPQATRLKVPPMRGRYALIVSIQGDKGKLDIERRADFVVQ